MSNFIPPRRARLKRRQVSISKIYYDNNNNNGYFISRYLAIITIFLHNDTDHTLARLVICYNHVVFIQEKEINFIVQ